MDNILPLSRRTDAAFLNAAVVFYRVVERVTSQRAAVQRVLLVSPRGVIYICFPDGRVTHTLHCLDVKWLRIDPPSTIVWADKNDFQTMISFRSDHISNLALCSVDYFQKVVCGFNPELKIDSEEAKGAPLELVEPPNMWTQMLQGVRAIRRLDEDYITYLNTYSSDNGGPSLLSPGKNHEDDNNNNNNNGGDDQDEAGGADAGGASGERGHRRKSARKKRGGGRLDNSDDDDIETAILGRSGAAPPLIIDEDVTPLRPSSFAQPPQPSQPIVPAGAAAAKVAPSLAAKSKTESDDDGVQHQEGATEEDVAAGTLALPAAAKQHQQQQQQTTAVSFGKIRVTRSSEPEVPAQRLYSLEILGSKLILIADQQQQQSNAVHNINAIGGAVNLDDCDMFVMDIVEGGFPNSRDFSFVMAGNGNVISASWESSAVMATIPESSGKAAGGRVSDRVIAAALQKLTNKLLRAVKDVYPQCKIKTGSSATAELMHLSQSVTSLSKKVGELQRSAYKTPFQEQQEQALFSLLQLICAGSGKSRRSSVLAQSQGTSLATTPRTGTTPKLGGLHPKQQSGLSIGL